MKRQFECGIGTTARFIVMASLFAGLLMAADWTDATVTNVASVAGTTAGIPSNASCCIEYTIESEVQRLVLVKFWYYKPPQPVFEVGQHVRFRKKKGWTTNFEVSGVGGTIQKLNVIRIEQRANR